jgi:hypothetical protein
MKLRVTNKLFYKKYPYKISCYIPGGYLIKVYGIGFTKEFCKGAATKSYLFAERLKDPQRLEELSRFTEAYAVYDKKVKIRAERNIFDLYCDDSNLYQSILKDLGAWIKGVTEPSNQQELEFLTQNSHKKIVCNVLPHKSYQYRITISHKIDPGTREKFSTWVRNYDEKLKFPGNTVKWLSGQWAWQPAIYVKDSSTLSMLGLFLGNNILKIEEFIPRSHINSDTN